MNFRATFGDASWPRHNSLVRCGRGRGGRGSAPVRTNRMRRTQIRGLAEQKLIGCACCDERAANERLVVSGCVCVCRIRESIFGLVRRRRRLGQRRKRAHCGPAASRARPLPLPRTSRRAPPECALLCTATQQARFCSRQVSDDDDDNIVAKTRAIASASERCGDVNLRPTSERASAHTHVHFVDVTSRS